MQVKTRGIVVFVTRYSESGVVARIYTEWAGLQSFFINGVRSKRSKISAALLQPMTPVDMVLAHKENRDLQRITEIRHTPGMVDASPDIIKTSLRLFMQEVLHRGLREQEANPPLFVFLSETLSGLEQSANLSLFPACFLIRLSGHLGFGPSRASGAKTYFDLAEGRFTDEQPSHINFMDPLTSSYFLELLSCSPAFTPGHLSVPSAARKLITEKLLDYYRLHLPAFGEIKSHRVLEEVLK